MSIEEERRKRIQVALWAYAYEIMNDPIVPDSVYDKVARSIDTSIETGNKEMDEWFKKNFIPDTGQWIHIHPHVAEIQQIYTRLRKEAL